ncbi:hypothetical protein ACQPTN_09385 [Bradyrhizobium sp. 13971]
MTESIVDTLAPSVAAPGAVSPRKVFWATWFGWMLDGFEFLDVRLYPGRRVERIVAGQRYRAEQGQYRHLWRAAVLDLHAGLGLLDGLGLGRGPLRTGPDHVLDGAGLLAVHGAVRACDRYA